MRDCGEYDCVTCYGKEKIPLTIDEICPPSSQPLIEAIYAQDINAVTELLSRDSSLANSWVSLRASNYKTHRCPGPESATESLYTIEPILLFAATIHHYKTKEKYSRNIPEESIALVQVIVHHGGRIPSTPPAGASQVAWRNACFQYGTAVQDCPAILELCFQAAPNQTRTTVIEGSNVTMPTACWHDTLRYAARYDADRSMGLLLDILLAQGCRMQDFLPDMYVAARYGNKAVMDAFLNRGGAAFVNSHDPMSLADQTLLLTTAICNPFHPRNAFDFEAIPKREALFCALIDAGATTRYNVLLTSVCQWAGHRVLDRIRSKRRTEARDELIYNGVVFPSTGTDKAVGSADEPSHLHIAAMFLNIAAVESIILHDVYNVSDNFKRTPLHWFALGDNIHYGATVVEMPTWTTTVVADRVRRAVRTAHLLTETAEVQVNQQDQYGRTAIHYACMLKRVELIATLAALGAKMNIKDNSGRTPVHSFAEEWTDPDGRMLESESAYPSDLTAVFKKHASADIDTVDHARRTALAVACSAFSAERVKVLLALGANPNTRDMNAWTPLHHAMCRPQRLRREGEIEIGPTTKWDTACVAMEAMQSLLLAAGADAGARNDAGQTPAEVADQEAKAAAEDRKLMDEQIRIADRREAETRRQMESWRTLVLDEVARTHGRRADKVPLSRLMRVVGQAGFGRGKVTAPPSSLSDTQCKAISKFLEQHFKGLPAELSY